MIAFVIAFAWVGLGPTLLINLTFCAPNLTFVYPLVWTAGVALDFYTTYRFYRQDPGAFEKNELSGYMRRLYRVFGFRAGLVAFLLLVELPIASLIALLLIPASVRVFSIQQPSFPQCFVSSLAFHGIIHLGAAGWNALLERRGP
ncbi:MAG: hypothetical protein QXG35_08685 [Nitrososphaerota archaeon]